MYGLLHSAQGPDWSRDAYFYKVHCNRLQPLTAREAAGPLSTSLFWTDDKIRIVSGSTWHLYFYSQRWHSLGGSLPATYLPHSLLLHESTVSHSSWNIYLQILISAHLIRAQCWEEKGLQAAPKVVCFSVQMKVFTGFGKLDCGFWSLGRHFRWFSLT